MRHGLLDLEEGAREQELDPTDPDFIPNEYASGVVVGADGLILTNYHVLGDPKENDYFVWVQRQPYKVLQVQKVDKVVAGDPWTDLAVLRIAAENLQPVQYGDVTALRKGMIVLGLGNPYAIDIAPYRAPGSLNNNKNSMLMLFWSATESTHHVSFTFK